MFLSGIPIYFAVLLFNYFIYPGLLYTLLVAIIYYRIIGGIDLLRSIRGKMLLLLLSSLILLFSPLSITGFNPIVGLLLFPLILVLCGCSREYTIWGIYNIILYVVLVMGLMGMSNIFVFGDVYSLITLIFGLFMIYIINSNWFEDGGLYQIYSSIYTMSIILHMMGLNTWFNALFSTILAFIFNYPVIRIFPYRGFRDKAYNVILDRYLTYNSIVFIYLAVIALMVYLG